MALLRSPRGRLDLLRVVVAVLRALVATTIAADAGADALGQAAVVAADRVRETDLVKRQLKKRQGRPEQGRPCYVDVVKS
jgi:hypothetical protein